jgi:hypothetical protein
VINCSGESEFENRMVNTQKKGVSWLSMNYYMFSCPYVDSVVKNNVQRAFHDCFIQVTFSLTLSDSITILTCKFYFIFNFILIIGIYTKRWLIFVYYRDVMGLFWLIPLRMTQPKRILFQALFFLDFQQAMVKMSLLDVKELYCHKINWMYCV